MDYKKEAQQVFNFTKLIIDECGPRLPGSEEEAKAVPIIARELEKSCGTKAIIEPFKIAPNASIGAIPTLGMMGFVSVALFYVSPIATIAMLTLMLIHAVLQIFCYTGIFDFLFHKLTSHNVYSVIEPKSGKVDYTLIYSGHNDSSWNWTHSASSPKTMIFKTVCGVLGCALLLAIAIAAVATGHLSFNDIKQGMNAQSLVIYLLPLITLIPFYWLASFLSMNKKTASPGAMDNLTGVGLSMVMGRYFKNNPDKQPKNARIIVMGLGAEEAGLKGSFAFVKKHMDADDGLLVNPYLINLDSFRDYDHFNVVKGDLWLFSRFDKDMRRIALESMRELGCKPTEIVNPIGGCDSTPFCRKGVPTVTLCAQNPTATDYYHTFRDHYDNLNMDTLVKSCEVVEKFTENMIKYIESNPQENKK